MPQLSDVLMNAVNCLDKPELSLSKISEEGIADMNLPDNILDDFDFNNDDDNEEIITSCNRVSVLFNRLSFAISSIFLFVTSLSLSRPLSQVKYSISELDNNLSIVVPANNNEAKRSKFKDSFYRHYPGGNNGNGCRPNNGLSLHHDIIQEISHENISQSQDDEHMLDNGHHADCNINRHRRIAQNSVGDSNSIVSSTAKAPHSNHHTITAVIEEAPV